jgi:hypothetical protein
MPVFSLALTWLVEWAVVAFVLRRSDTRLACTVLLINCLTQPLASGACYELNLNFWLVETMVCLVEFPLYRLLLRVSWFEGGLITVAANTASASLSFLL